jgi:phage anti-repressor protein
MKKFFWYLMIVALTTGLVMVSSCSKEKNSSQYAYDLQAEMVNLDSIFIFNFNTGYYSIDTGYKILINAEKIEVHLVIQDNKSGWLQWTFFKENQKVNETDSIHYNCDTLFTIPLPIDSLSMKSEIFTGLINFSIQPYIK